MSFLGSRANSISAGSDGDGSISPPLRQPTTLAEMFSDYWDPEFAAYLKEFNYRSGSSCVSPMEVYNTKPQLSSLIKPTSFNQLKTNEYSSSVSNYTINNVLAVGMEYGYEHAEAAITRLLVDVPKPMRKSFRDSVVKRARLLVEKKIRDPLCAFCRNNGQPAEVYKTHIMRDEYGRTRCPKLRAYTCPYCQASGDNAHTISYCPLNPGNRSNSSLHRSHQF